MPNTIAPPARPVTTSKRSARATSARPPPSQRGSRAISASGSASTPSAVHRPYQVKPMDSVPKPALSSSRASRKVRSESSAATSTRPNRTAPIWRSSTGRSAGGAGVPAAALTPPPLAALLTMDSCVYSNGGMR